jgi:flagellin
MSLRINFNSAAVQTHQNLKVADRMMTKSLERLSSGERINRSDDDPSGLVAANSIRHNLAGILRSTNNIEEGVSLLQTADGAMDGISGLLVRLRSLALGAANEAVNDPAQLVAYQADFDEAVRSISRIADQARFGSIPLLQGNLLSLIHI